MFLVVSQTYSILTCSLNLYHNIDTLVLSRKVNILIQLYYIYIPKTAQFTERQEHMRAKGQNKFITLSKKESHPDILGIHMCYNYYIICTIS